MENIYGKKEKNIVNKSLFSVGLIAIFLSLYQFKEELGSIIIQGENKSSISLLSVIIMFSICLIISVYFYALSYIKYSFGEKVQEFFIFKIIVFLGDLFYSTAMFYPILILIIYISHKFNFLNQYIFIFDTIGIVSLFIFGIFTSNLLPTPRVLSTEIVPP